MNTTQRVLDFIIKYKTEHDGNSPTVREIGDGTGLASFNTVKYHLDKLVADGRITIEPGVTRSIRVKGGQWRMVADD